MDNGEHSAKILDVANYPLLLPALAFFLRFQSKIKDMCRDKKQVQALYPRASHWSHGQAGR